MLKRFGILGLVVAGSMFFHPAAASAQDWHRDHGHSQSYRDDSRDHRDYDRHDRHERREWREHERHERANGNGASAPGRVAVTTITILAATTLLALPASAAASTFPGRAVNK